ncbi:MAG: nucleotidyl transferase AbiEii/AbiGii toxin family protein [Holophagaceae bacterium]|jgi:predicted nucleotidyltransferase component of viral defense system|nr:nucleotidyl transferase AbiEii/AbiGii toxin family protein [Holophagaceae bacterium]
MKFASAWQLKDWIKNKSKQTGTTPNALMQTYMMERLLERLSISPYRNNFILKGGFLIAAMVGVGRRTTKDLDATAKGLSINQNNIKAILNKITSLDAGDGANFEIQDIKNIHDISEYDDFRVSVRASIYTIRTNLKIDITIGDTIIPKEIEYQYKLMFEDRTIPVMAYNLCTILAEKIETILARNITNSRGRDFYDAYILLSMYKDSIPQKELFDALRIKATERGTLNYVNDYARHLKNIADSPEISKIWTGYSKIYTYAKGIALSDVLSIIENQIKLP